MLRGILLKVKNMDKIAKLLEIAKKRMPSVEILNIQKTLKNMTMDELLERFNQVNTDDDYHATIYELVDRCTRGEGPWNVTD